MTNFQPHNDDVVSMESGLSIINAKTFKVSQLLQGLKDHIRSSAIESWVGEGTECEFLRASTGGGWQTGKMRIRLEFVPDVPDPELDDSSSPEQSDAVLSPDSEQPDQLNQ